MFGHSYFGSIYDGASYFGPASAGGPPPIPPGTINYQGDGYTKKHRRRKRKIDELFAELEASIRAAILGEPALAQATMARIDEVATPPSYQADLTRLIALASDYADLSARVHRLQSDIAAAHARQRTAQEQHDEDDVIMLLL